MTRQEFFSLPEISSHFPLVYSNGAHWDSMKGECGSCRASFPPASFRGEITHPFRGVFILDGFGLCEGCNLLTPFRYRLHDDMSMTGLDKTGEWARWASGRTVWSRLRGFARKWLLGGL